MVQFTCTSCNKKLKVPDKYSGKKAKCPKCGQINVVPEESDSDANVIIDVIDTSECLSSQTKKDSIFGSSVKDSPTNNTAVVENRVASFATQKKSYAATMSKWVWMWFGVLALLLGGFVFYICAFRNTWDHDNFSKIMEMKIEAEGLAYNGNPQQALDTYEQIFELIGERQIRSDTFKDVVDETRINYTSLLSDYENDTYDLFVGIAKEASSMISNGSYSLGIEQYERILRESNARRPHAKKLRFFLRDIPAEINRAKGLEEQARNEAKHKAKEREEEARAEAEKRKNQQTLLQRLSNPTVINQNNIEKWAPVFSTMCTIRESSDEDPAAVLATLSQTENVFECELEYGRYTEKRMGIGGPLDILYANEGRLHIHEVEIVRGEAGQDYVKIQAILLLVETGNSVELTHGGVFLQGIFFIPVSKAQSEQLLATIKKQEQIRLRWYIVDTTDLRTRHGITDFESNTVLHAKVYWYEIDGTSYFINAQE